MSKPRIWLEPGHGGTDPGAVGNGMRESDITLDVGLRLRDLLLPAFDVGMTRTADVNLVNRVSRANGFNPDLVVSIHVNAGGGTGVETLIPTASPNNPSRDLQANRRLAEKMSNALANAFGMRVRRTNGVKLETETRHPFIGILRETRAIAVLPEIAFIDSPLSNPDIDVLRNRRGEAAKVLAEVIYGWFGIPFKEATPIMNVELVNIRELPWVNRGDVYQITDLLTGLKYNIVGSHNNQRHADYVCATREDTNIKLRTANNNFNNNWAARPVILTIGNRHFAASTHNAAHAPDMRKWRDPAAIGHNGHFCVWVLGAQTGGSASYKRDMLAAVQRAYEMTGVIEEDEDMTQEKFDVFMDAYLRSLGQLPPSDWAKDELKKAQELGITDGSRPQAFVTRQEAAVMAVRAAQSGSGD
jgi:N-acetylmuramoyl-L-alanine amidase